VKPVRAGWCYTVPWSAFGQREESRAPDVRGRGTGAGRSAGFIVRPRAYVRAGAGQDLRRLGLESLSCRPASSSATRDVDSAYRPSTAHAGVARSSKQDAADAGSGVDARSAASTCHATRIGRGSAEKSQVNEPVDDRVVARRVHIALCWSTARQ
jgi:hypothetical protein